MIDWLDRNTPEKKEYNRHLKDSEIMRERMNATKSIKILEENLL